MKSDSYASIGIIPTRYRLYRLQGTGQGTCDAGHAAGVTDRMEVRREGIWEGAKETIVSLEGAELRDGKELNQVGMIYQLYIMNILCS